jgi:hypothetical protein
MVLLKALAALTTALLFMLSPPVKAAPITYNWTTTSSVAPAPFTLNYSAQLVVDDSALLTGLQFSMDCFFSPPITCTNTGNVEDFISLTDASPGFGDLSMSLIFNADGTLTGTIDEDGLNQNLHLAGSGLDWETTSQFHSDRHPICGPCELEGYWLRAGYEVPTVIPEPASIAILGSGMFALLGFAGVRRIRRRSA